MSEYRYVKKLFTNELSEWTTSAGIVVPGGVLNSKMEQTKSANYTMAATDSGYITKVDTASVTITLPSTAVGLVYHVETTTDGVGLTISPAIADKIVGLGQAGTDNKDALLTNANARKGDYIKLFGDGADGWYVMEAQGTWTFEA